MTTSPKKALDFPANLLGLALGLYALIGYLITHYQLGVDFSSFYASLLALAHGHNPYTVLVGDFLPDKPLLSANLNPPVFLLLLKPFTGLPYLWALTLWTALTVAMEFVGIALLIQQAFPASFIKRHWGALFSISLLFYPTLINTECLQMGGPLLFFIMLGYHYYTRQQDTRAGILWGIIIALKFFPGLLVLLALSEKRYRVVAVTGVTVLILFALPWIIYGSDVNQTYAALLPRVRWYGDNWNASLYGFLFRFFGDPLNTQTSLVLVKSLFMLLFIPCLVGYYFLLTRNYHLRKSAPHRLYAHLPICLTLTAMLLLSPFGWIYYCPLLLFPYAITYQAYLQTTSPKSSYLVAWFTSFFLINLPIDYVKVMFMPNWYSKIGLFSLYFYSLLLLLFLCIKMPATEQSSDEFETRITQPASAIFLILLMNAIWPALSFILLWYKSIV